MPEIEFEHHRVNSRKDLIDFITEHGDKEILKHIGDNPKAWLEELNFINHALMGNPLVGMTGLNSPPVNESGFRELGNGAFHYSGRFERLRGLWVHNLTRDRLEGMADEGQDWTQYRLGEKAVLRINKEFSDIPFEKLLPENFEPEATVEKSNKRPILTFPVKRGDEEITVFAKGAFTALSYFYEHSKPSYRLTSISNISKTTSRTEMETTLALGNLGINVPRIIGHYDSLYEEFLFLEMVKGTRPGDFLPKYRAEIIRQDAEMLATLCLAGYSKVGFPDFDDKIFDGSRLHLIDMEEFRDLYFASAPDFRDVLLNPRDSNKLREFRNLQRSIFTGQMRDALYRYKDSLTPAYEDKVAYIKTFYKKMKWKQPDVEQVAKLVDFPSDYMTQDNWMSMMSDTE